MQGTLYIVATPIGNLQDITFRALETLKSVDLIACEDTRHTGKLLKSFDIENRLISYHEHNEAERSEELCKKMIAGMNIALVSDAGTPCISDPGHRLIQMAHEQNITVVPLPGPAAFVAALSASGIASKPMLFEGFLPSKNGESRSRLKELSSINATIILYEAPHRLLRTLEYCLEIMGDRRATAARELTKLHEEIITGNLSDILNHFSSANIRGEFVLIIDRVGEVFEKQDEASLADRVEELESNGLDRKTAMKKAAKEFGLTRSEAYRRLNIS